MNRAGKQQFYTLILLAGLVFCPTNPIQAWQGEGSEASPQSVEDQIEELVANAIADYQEKRFDVATEKFSRALKLGSQDASVGYNAACCAALANQADDAFTFLNKAIELGWSDHRHMRLDNDLDSLHDDARWEKLIEGLRNQAKRIKRRWKSKVLSTPFAENVSDAEKAAGLSILWSEVKFNFVNFANVPDLDWDQKYMEYMPRVLETESTLEYYRLLEELVAQLKDGHTNVYLPGKLKEQFDARPGMRTRLMEGRVIVTEVFDPALNELGIHVGQELLEVDGVPVIEYAEKNIRPYMSASTPQDSDERTFGYFLLRGDLSRPLSLKLENADGQQSVIEVKRLSRSNASGLANGSPSFELKMLEGNFAHVSLNSFGSNQAATDFAARFDEISNAEAIILDVRDNGGGNSSVGWQILSHLTDQPFPTTRWHTLQYRPTFRAWQRNPLSQHGDDNGEYPANGEFNYQKPVVVLTGPGTYSAAEDMVAAFDMMDRGQIIGQPTGGSTGQPLMFQLPGGGSGRVCTKHDSYADGTEFVGKGIQPDVLVLPAVADLRNEMDSVLKAAIELLNAKK